MWMKFSTLIVIVSSQSFAEPAIPQCVYFIFSITLGAQKYFEVREQIRGQKVVTQHLKSAELQYKFDDEVLSTTVLSTSIVTVSSQSFAEPIPTECNVFQKLFIMPGPRKYFLGEQIRGQKVEFKYLNYFSNAVQV